MKYAKSVISFGADMSSFVHIDNKKKNILILGESPTQRLDDATLTAGTINRINFTQPRKKSVLSLHHNGSNSFLFVSAKKYINSKQKSINSKDFTVDNIKKKQNLKE